MNTTTTELNAGWMHASTPPKNSGWYQVRRAAGSEILDAFYKGSAGEWIGLTGVVYPLYWRSYRSNDCGRCDAWIDVYDQMPNIGENVTLLCSNTRFTGHFDGTAWQVNGGCIISGVTHWQRIPPLSQRPDGWLDLNDRIPPNRHPVLCLTDDGPVVGYRDCELWFATLGDKAVRVKAWRELPAYGRSGDCCDDGFEAWWNSLPVFCAPVRWVTPDLTGRKELARAVWTAARNAR